MITKKNSKFIIYTKQDMKNSFKDLGKYKKILLIT